MGTMSEVVVFMTYKGGSVTISPYLGLLYNMTRIQTFRLVTHTCLPPTPRLLSCRSLFLYNYLLN